MIKNHGIRMVLYKVFSLVYVLARYMFKMASFVFGPLIRLHPRTENFAASLAHAFKELVAPPRIGPAATPPATIGQVAEAFKKAETEMQIPQWLVDEWKAVHDLEPLLFPQKWLLENIVFYQVPKSRLYHPYLELCRRLGGNADHVFLAPWLVKGGADLVVINYIKAVKEIHPAGNVVLFTTLNVDSPWKSRLPDGVEVIEFGKMFPELAPGEQENLLTRLFLQMPPKVIHNINSDLGYRILVKHGAALAEKSRLFVSSFCVDFTEEGMEAGYPIAYLPHCIDHLDGVVSENRAYLDKLVERYAYDPEKLYVTYQPAPVAKPERGRSEIQNDGRLNILWAGRLDRQKRPDILIDIAKQCENLPFRFHVFGSAIIDTDIYRKSFEKLKNLEYRGPFNGLPSLAVGEYDLYLYTSQWDGLPNILMEAMSVGLPIVASDVGGISELVIHEKTGFLVDPFDDTEKYVACLRRISEDRASLARIVNEASALIASRHSWDSFVDNVKRVPGYYTNA